MQLGAVFSGVAALISIFALVTAVENKQAATTAAIKEAATASITAQDLTYKASTPGTPGLILEIKNAKKQTMIACPGSARPYLTDPAKEWTGGVKKRDMPYAASVCDRVRALAS